ncbi:MAG: 50S ribosomal protein L3 [Deltaproteobacteria bacterium]|nr:50S ribosomal protein L3 [Deltaproteobacteria bacterium]
MKGLIGKKIGMTTVFSEDGNAHAATVIEVSPNLVFGHRTQERDGYTALQIAHGELSEKQVKKATKPKLGEFKKKNLKPHKEIVEFRVDGKELAAHAVGSTLTVDLFKKGDKVDVSGTTRGFGFAGVFKRHHMKGAARDSSTAHELHRHIGAVGQRKTPGRVFLNKRLPGQMGVDERTIQNLAVLEIHADNNLIVVKGAIPGHRKGLVTIYPTVK